MIGKKLMDLTLNQFTEDAISIRRPVYIPLLSKFIYDCILNNYFGIYHFYNPNDKLTKYEIIKKIAGIINKDYDKIKSGSGPVTISFGEEVDEVKVNLSKLDNHPWVVNPKLIKDNLNTIWDNFLKNINGMLIFKYPGADKGIFMDINEINSKFKPWRIVMNSLLAKAIITIKKEPQDIESEEENM